MDCRQVQRCEITVKLIVTDIRASAFVDICILGLFKDADINQLWGRGTGLSAKLKGVSLQLGFHLYTPESWVMAKANALSAAAVSISVSLVMSVHDVYVKGFYY